MFNYMGATEEMVEEGVKKYGLAKGARTMIDHEYLHADQSLTTGIYITYSNPQKKSECFRLGTHSKCFCGHKMGAHNQKYFGKKFDTVCTECNCKLFKFVPTRPEECGMYWLVRRKDFNVNTWRPPCKCKHNTDEHSCNFPLKCKKCSCYGFDSNFACLTCDGLWEHHEVLYETADERQILKKPIGQEYMPLNSHQHIQKEVFNAEKFSRIPNRSLPSKQQKVEQAQMHSKLNPKQPSKEEQAKLKSPLGIILKPKYPDFMIKKQ